MAHRHLDTAHSQAACAHIDTADNAAPGVRLGGSDLYIQS